jgi:aldose 1-epimerase
LHGGPDGFSNQVFEIDTTFSGGDSAVVALHYLSPDMEEGFPGNLKLSINFILTGDNEVSIEYHAETDKSTVVNFTNHSYFNLTGNQGSILDHTLKIMADHVTPTGQDKIPTGLISPVVGTRYDFTEAHILKEKLEPSSRGFDINYVLRKNGNELALAAELFDPASGRFLEAFTTEPGMQLFNTRNAICLEMQHFPDSPNKPDFPNVVLNPGEVYEQITVYRFSQLGNHQKSLVSDLNNIKKLQPFEGLDPLLLKEYD